jgi:hypothetical protein
MLYTKLGARRRAGVAGRQLRVGSLRVRTNTVYLDSCVRCVKWLIPGGDKRASIEHNVSSKYAWAMFGISAG